MFDQEVWREHIIHRLNAFARNPWLDVQIEGARTVLGYLAIRALEPFLEAFQQEPINAVLALSKISQGQGADHLVRRASQLRFQGARLLEREMQTNQELQETIEQVMVALNIIHLARQRLNSSRDEWMRKTLTKELDAFGAMAFLRVRRLLDDPGWKLRHDAIDNLKHQHGLFSPAELILLSDGLRDSVSDVRSAAARRLGEFSDVPPTSLVKMLVHVSLHDCDMKTRNAAARSLGGLRNRIASPEILEMLLEHLSNSDCFVRSATAMLVAELGELSGTPEIVLRLVRLLQDSDPYVREAVAHALGRIGTPALTREVIEGLTRCVQDYDPSVHEAAVQSLIRLRKLRAPGTRTGPLVDPSAVGQHQHDTRTGQLPSLNTRTATTGHLSRTRTHHHQPETTGGRTHHPEPQPVNQEEVDSHTDSQSSDVPSAAPHSEPLSKVNPHTGSSFEKPQTGSLPKAQNTSLSKPRPRTGSLPKPNTDTLHSTSISNTGTATQTSATQRPSVTQRPSPRRETSVIQKKSTPSTTSSSSTGRQLSVGSGQSASSTGRLAQGGGHIRRLSPSSRAQNLNDHSSS